MLITRQFRIQDWQLKWLKDEAIKNRVKSSSIVRHCISLLIAGKCLPKKLDNKTFEDTEFEARKKQAKTKK